MSLDPETQTMVCDRCKRRTSSDDDFYGWAIIDGRDVCAGCHTGEELEGEQTAAAKVEELLASPRGRAILKMVFRDLEDMGERGRELREGTIDGDA